MFCPKCRREYQERFSEFSECADCHVALVSEPYPTLDEAEPVVVFESDDRMALSLAHSLLESAGIPYLFERRDWDTKLVTGPLPFPAGRFLVLPQREQESRELLAQLEMPLPEDQDLP